MWIAETRGALEAGMSHKGCLCWMLVARRRSRLGLPFGRGRGPRGAARNEIPQQRQTDHAQYAEGSQFIQPAWKAEKGKHESEYPYGDPNEDYAAKFRGFRLISHHASPG